MKNRMAAMTERERRGVNARDGASRRRRRRRRGRVRAHFVLLLLFLLGLFVILSVTVFWQIEEIRVVGTDQYDPDLIAADSGILVGDNLLGIDKKDVAARILEKYPYVATVEVSRRFPPAVEITVTQNVPDGAIRKGDEVVLITAEGKVLERGKILIPESVPLVMGIAVDGPRPVEGEEVDPDIPSPVVRTKPGESLPETEGEKLSMLQNLLAAMKETGFLSITNVDLTDRLNMQIVYENRILLKLGVEADLTLKLETVRYILETQIDPGEEGTLDVSEVSKWTIFSPEFGESQRLEPPVGAVGLGGGEDPGGTDEAGALSDEDSGGTDEAGALSDEDSGGSDEDESLSDSVESTANSG